MMPEVFFEKMWLPKRHVWPRSVCCMSSSVASTCQARHPAQKSRTQATHRPRRVAKRALRRSSTLAAYHGPGDGVEDCAGRGRRPHANGHAPCAKARGGESGNLERQPLARVSARQKTQPHGRLRDRPVRPSSQTGPPKPSLITS